MFKRSYGNVFDGNPQWNAIPVSGGELYQWNESSTYIQEPPFFKETTLDVKPIQPIGGARVLAIFGDSVTTDRISPAGNIAENSPAGQYLISLGVKKADFNQYGTRRGNDRVLTRGTFANIRIKNLMVPGVEGGVTVHQPSGERMSIFDAAMKYKDAGIPLIVLASKEYGTGSSRDWAAKGPYLQGVRVVIAESFERIHRSNLVGLSDDLKPRQDVMVRAKKVDGSVAAFKATVRIDTLVEVDYYRNGGILQTVLRKLVKTA